MLGIRLLLVATDRELWIVDPEGGEIHKPPGLSHAHPTCVAFAGRRRGLWCGTKAHGLFRSDSAGALWRPGGLAGERVTAIGVGPAPTRRIWVGTEPSALWRSGEGSGEGETWTHVRGLTDLPSASEWAFPPRPETHHVRWITCDPTHPDRLWLAIEAGALVRTDDAGGHWHDRVPGGPRDTHELAVHGDRPRTLHSAAGDGYFLSRDGGASWTRVSEGLGVGYFRSVAIDPGDPGVIVVSGASRPRTAYVAGRSDGVLYRRVGDGPWERIRRGWPDPPATIAPLLLAGYDPGELWAADERGVHRSGDGGRSWELMVPFDPPPGHLRGLAWIDEPVRPSSVRES